MLLPISLQPTPRATLIPEEKGRSGTSQDNAALAALAAAAKNRARNGTGNGNDAAENGKL